MNRILSVRKTVKYYVYYNLGGIVLSNVVLIFILLGQPKDLIKAYAWMHLANEQGYTPARDDIYSIEQRLSEAEKSVALLLSKSLITSTE